MTKLLNVMLIILFICLAAGVGLFMHDASTDYSIDKDFVFVPLIFNPDDSTSTLNFENAEITVRGGFIKGIQNKIGGGQSVVVRALSPIPTLEIKGTEPDSVIIQLENINPDFYASRIDTSKTRASKLSVNSLELDLQIGSGETVRIDPSESDLFTSENAYKYIILGDNRDGYDTFEQIIEQVNGLNPVFVIDNGDLVFSGKPNQYRLFDKLMSQISSTVCTSLGNHDIRGDGRTTYTKLYGPAYYSFDFGKVHFAFLDSSPGWAERTAISEEQYSWLESDLEKSRGKQIFVVTHIPPHDPRSNVTENEIPNYVNELESGNSWFEQKLNDYSASKSMNHGFQDPDEARRFESLMSEYNVDTVYLSHIHSYLEYSKDGVRYLITGGAGAELLTKNSYYHYMIASLNASDAGEKMTVVELPSPANNYIARYSATLKLFADAMYRENPVSVVLIIAGFVLLIFLICVKVYLWKKHVFEKLGKWTLDTFKYAVKRFKEMK